MARAVADLCRITIVGPSGRADLGVPLSTPVAELIPQFVRFVVSSERTGDVDQDEGAWVLQRMGEVPFGPSATAESAGWLDGELFHLVRAEDPLPELDFDDVSDAIATAVDRRADRWNPTAQRVLFSGLAVSATSGALAELATLRAAPAALALAALLIGTWTVRAARSTTGGALVSWGCLLAAAGAAAAGLRLGQGLESPVVSVAGLPALLACLGAAATGGVLLGVRASPLAPDLPVAAPAVVVIVAGGVAGGLLVASTGAGAAAAAGVWSVLALVAAVLAPRAATRWAGITLPQLPRSAEELQVDVEPMAAEDAVRLTARAEGYLTAIIVAASVLICCAAWVLALAPGWTAWALAAVVSVLAAMRAREVLSVPQRVALVAAAALAAAPVLARSAVLFHTAGSAVGAVLLLAAGWVAVATARRPPLRRLRPGWRQFVLIAEGVLAASCVPLLFGVLNLYSVARSWAG